MATTDSPLDKCYPASLSTAQEHLHLGYNDIALHQFQYSSQEALCFWESNHHFVLEKPRPLLFRQPYKFQAWTVTTVAVTVPDGFLCFPTASVNTRKMWNVWVRVLVLAEGQDKWQVALGHSTAEGEERLSDWLIDWLIVWVTVCLRGWPAGLYGLSDWQTVAWLLLSA